MHHFEILPPNYMQRYRAWHPAWFAFSQSILVENLNKTNEQILFERNRILQEKYNALFMSGVAGSGYLDFETAEDMMQFLLEWS